MTERKKIAKADVDVSHGRGRGRNTGKTKLDAVAKERAAVWLERMVQTLLAVVLGQALFRNDRLLTNEFDVGDFTAVLGLCTVMFLALSSWMALAQLLSEVPYSVQSKAGSLRLYADTAAIFLYSYLLLTLHAPERCVVTSSCGLAGAHYYSYPAVFICYAIASAARRRQEIVQLRQGDLKRQGRKRPAPRAALITAALLLAPAIAFNFLLFQVKGSALRWVSTALLVWILVVIVGYRLRWYAAIRRAL